MKKILFAVMAVLVSFQILGFSAAVSPYKIGVNTQQNVFVITVSNCVTDNAVFEFSIPPEFYTAPDLNGNVSGAVSAVVMKGGTIPEQVLNTDMIVNGFLVKINKVSLSANDTLVFTYGKTDAASGLYGINAPSNETELYFEVKYSQDNWATYVIADEAPKVRVIFMDLIKSVSASRSEERR